MHKYADDLQSYLEQDIGVHLQEIGREFGSTTGRRRRCGWLDLVVLKHSCWINGYDTFNLTKLDILDQISEIKVAIAYKIDGKELDGFPGSFIFHFPFSLPYNSLVTDEIATY